MLNEVYITRSAKYLPNEAISNDEMEEYLGLIGQQHSRSKRIVLRNNGIKKRYYAIDKNGQATHSNAQLTANAIKSLFQDSAHNMSNVEVLSCGTSTPDQFIPSHGVMVHGHLPEMGLAEVVSPSGVCCSGMHALKYAWMSVKLGQASLAVATGSERVSRLLRSEMFEEEAAKLAAAEENPYITFDKEFLRWMLSDGAGALLLSNQADDKQISLRVEFIDGVSYAHLVEPCMYSGSDKLEDGTLKGYMDFSHTDLLEHSVLGIKQDVKLLSKHIVDFGFDKMKALFAKHHIKSNELDHFLPHISSEFFRSKMADKFDAEGLHIPQQNWFTNLSEVGNVGSGSIYLIIEELMNSGKLKKGEKIFVAVPESARFSYMFALFTVC